MYIARCRPELNKQVQSLDLTLFPMETGITWLVLSELQEHWAYADFFTLMMIK